MKKVIIIEADTNDADYITEETSLEGWGDIDILALVKKVTDAINQRTQENKGKRNYYNWDVSEYAHGDRPEELYEGLLTEEEIDIFSEIMPHGEYGTHTIKSIRIVEIASDEELLK